MSFEAPSIFLMLRPTYQKGETPPVLYCMGQESANMLLYDTWLKYRFILRHNRGEVVCQPGFHQLEHALKAKT